MVGGSNAGGTIEDERTYRAVKGCVKHHPCGGVHRERKHKSSSSRKDGERNHGSTLDAVCDLAANGTLLSEIHDASRVNGKDDKMATLATLITCSLLKM